MILRTGTISIVMPTSHASFRLNPVARALLARSAKREKRSDARHLEFLIEEDAKRHRMRFPSPEEAELELDARRRKMPIPTSESGGAPRRKPARKRQHH